MSSTNIEKRMRYLQSSRNGNRLSLSTSVSKEKLQELSELRHKNSQMRSVPAAGKAKAFVKKNTEAENNGSVAHTPSSSVSKKDNTEKKEIDKSGTSKAFEGARNHISDLVNSATKPQTSKAKAIPDGIRFDKTKIGFGVEQVKKQAEATPKKDTKLNGVSDDVNSKLNRIMREYKTIQKTKRGPEFNTAVGDLVSENQATLDEYARQTGRTANLTDIAYQFEKKEKEDWENKLNEGYRKRLENYYKVTQHSDFEAYVNGKHNGKKTPYDKVGSAIKNIRFLGDADFDVVDNSNPVYYKYTTDEKGENEKIEMLPVDHKDKKAVKYLYMTDDEYKIYKYHLNKYGEKSANKFLKDIASVLDARATEAMSLYTKGFAKEHKILGTANDLALSLGSGIGAFVDAKVQGVKQNNSTPNDYIPYNPYSDASRAVHEQKANKEGVIGDLTGVKKFAADTAFSIGENAVRLPLGYAGLPIMGLSVAGSTAVEQGLNGETNANRAWNTGAVYGAIEIATEKVSLDNIIDIVNAPAKTVKEFAKNLIVNLAKQAGIEASEEWVAEIADNIADNTINGDKSEYNELIKAYQDNGDTRNIAEAKAFIEKFVKDPVVAAGSGALSGLVMGAGSSGVAQATYVYDTSKTGKFYKSAGSEAVNALVEGGLESGQDTAAYQSAEKMKQKIEGGKKLTNLEVGLQVQNNIDAIEAEKRNNDLLNEEVQKRFADNVDKVFRGELPRERVIEIGHTPRLLQEYGASDLLMSITQNTMYKIAYPTGYFGAEDGGHNLGIPALKQLPSQIAEPTAILKSNSQNDSIVLLTEWKDTKGNPVIVPLHLDKNGILGMTNEIASAYGKKDMTPLLTDSNGDSTVLYTKNNEDIHQLLQAGLQLPSVVADDTLVNNSISQNEQNVNNEVNTKSGNTWQASQLTPSIASHMNGLAGAPSDMSGIETANNTVRSGEYNVFDRDFVNSYADGFVQGMAERNSNAYRTLSSVTDNLARELVNYTLTGQSGLADNQAFRVTAEAFRNVLTDAVNKNAIVHGTSYGNKTRLAEQAAAVRDGDFSVMNIGELQNVDAYTDTDRIHGLIQDEFADVLTDTERNAIDSLATAVGRTVKIVPTIGNGKADGCRIGDVLYIAANANDKFTYVFAHELTHSLEGTDGYRNYSGAILDRLAREEGVTIDELVSRKIAEYGEGGIKLDDTGARQELVADFTKNILTDENKAMEFVNSIENAQQRRTVIQWLCDAIHNLINRIRGKFNADVVRLNELERISDMFEGMLKEAANDNTVQTDGETQFLFAGKNAKTANIGTLAQAESLENEGMSAEDIRLQTGWARGLDGKWRFEIDDSKARFIGGDITGSHKLSDILEHDVLYEAYPELKDMEVFVTDNMDIKGKYNPELDKILLNENLSDAEKRTTLLHEVQHAIQVREGFAVGADSEMPGYRDTAGEIEARDVSARADMTAEERQVNFPESMKPREGVVFADNEEYSISFDNSAGNTNELIKVLQNNQQNILQERAVFDVKQSDIVRAEQPSDTVLNYFNSVGNIAINPTLGEVELVKSGAKATVFHGVGDKKITAVAAIKDIIEKGKIINHEKQWKGRNYDTYVLAGHGLIDDKPAILGVVIKSYPKQNLKNRFYVHEIIKIGASSDGAVNYDAASVNEPTPTSNNIISENEPIVKKSVKENTGNQTKTGSFKNWFGDWENDPDNASKVVNEDGTPKVVYHGTDNQFTVFSTSNKRTTGRLNLGEGIYLTPKKSRAQSYTSTNNVMELYADVKNPFKIIGNQITEDEINRLRDMLPKSEREKLSRNNFNEYLQQAGYDGIFAINYNGTTNPIDQIVVFNSTQIKSATDNIGTFDPNNADIRFAKRDNSDEMNSANRAASALMKKYNANGRGLYVQDVTDAMKALSEEIHDISYSEETFPKIKSSAENITRMILENARVVDESTREEYDNVRKYAKGLRIKITDELRGLTDFNELKGSLLGYGIYLTNDGTPVDVVYKDLAAEFPQYFDEQEQMTQSDQLYHILDTIRGLKPQESPLSEEEYDIAFENLTGDIISRAINIAENYKPRKVKEASQYDDADWNDLAHSDKAWQEWDKQRQEKDRDRQRYNKKLQQIQEKANERIKRAAEMRRESEDKTKLLNIARRLNNMKLSPENKALIPDIVYELDTVSKGILKEGYTTVDGKVVMGELDLKELRDNYMMIKETDPDWLPDKNIEARIGRLDKRQIADMDISDVRELVQTLQQVEHEIRTNNKMLRDAQNREIAQVADECIKELRGAKGLSEKQLTKTFSWIEKQWNRQLNPEQFFKRMVGYEKDSTFVGIGKALDEGQTKSLVFKQKSSERFNHLIQQKENMKKFTGKDAEWIDISKYDPEGRKLYITQEMRTALSLQSKNYANLRHIKYGGITIPNRILYENGNFVEAYKRGTIVKLTPSQVQQITAEMTPFEREFAEAAYKFFNEDSKQAINETSLILNGYEKATVKDYFPIVGNKAFIRGEFESLSRNGTLEGKGILEERQYASNPIVLEALTKVIVRHADDVAGYYGLAIPIRNFNKVYNATGKNYSHSFKDEFNHKWSENETKYIENLMADLQGARSGTGSKTVAKLNSNYAKATLTLNFGVMLQQSGSYPTAAAELGYKALAKAFTEKVTDEDIKIINKYTPYYYIRQQGYTTSEIGDFVNGNSEDWTKQGKMPLVMGGIQRVDLATTAKLWKATEFYIRDNYKDLKVGSDEYYRKVAEKYETVLKRTQPMYTTMQRSDLLRETDSVVKSTTMFRSQPSQNHNLIYDASNEFKARYLDYKENPNETTRADFVEARKRLAWTLSSQIIQAMVVTACRAAGYALRGQLKKHYLGEKEDREWWEQFLIDGGSLISGNLWFGSQLFDTAVAIEGIFTGRSDTVYDMEAPSLAMLNDVTTGVLGLIKDVAHGKKGTWGIIKSANKLLTDVLQMSTGTPIKNVEKYVKGICANVVSIHNFFSEEDWHNWFDLADEMSGNTHGIPMKKWGEYIEYVKDTQMKMEKGLPGYVNKTTGEKYKDPAETARQWANKKYGTK